MGCHIFLQGISPTRDQTCVSCIGRWVLYPLSHLESPLNTVQKQYTRISLWVQNGFRYGLFTLGILQLTGAYPQLIFIREDCIIYWWPGKRLELKIWSSFYWRWTITFTPLQYWKVLSWSITTWGPSVQSRSWWGQEYRRRIRGVPRPRQGFPGGSVVKNPPGSVGDARDFGSIPGSGRSPGEGNGNPLYYACLENSTDRRAWQAAVHGVTKRHGWVNVSMRGRERENRHRETKNQDLKWDSLIFKDNLVI